MGDYLEAVCVDGLDAVAGALERLSKGRVALVEAGHGASGVAPVGGESLGGLLALYLASEHPQAAGVLAYASALMIKPSFGPASARLARHSKIGSSTS